MANLVFIGSSSANLGDDEIKFLGKLFGAMLYNEIDIASTMLLKAHADLVIDISQSSRALGILADLCYNNRKN